MSGECKTLYQLGFSNGKLGSNAQEYYRKSEHYMSGYRLGLEVYILNSKPEVFELEAYGGDNE